MFSIRMAAAAAALSGDSPAAPAKPSDCSAVERSVAAARALYEALPERVEDDAAPVDDLAFTQALAAPRGEDEDIVRWRFAPPEYSFAALRDGVEASCAAVFDVATNGRAINLAVSCTDLRFEPDMRRSAATMLFLPARKGGAAVLRRRIALPIALCPND